MRHSSISNKTGSKPNSSDFSNKVSTVATAVRWLVRHEASVQTPVQRSPTKRNTNKNISLAISSHQISGKTVLKMNKIWHEKFQVYH